MTYNPGDYEPRQPMGAAPPIIPPTAPSFPPHVVAPLPPKKSRVGLIVGLVVAGLVVLGGAGAIGAAIANGRGKPATSAATPAVVAATGVPVKCVDGVTSNTGLPNYCSGHGGVAPARPAPVVLPKATDFSLAVKVLRKACFGSAGCNITYRIDPTYNGAPFPAGVKFEVVYQVNGGQDGPQINRFTIGAGSGPGNAWEASVQEEELISTKSSSAVLTAVVTDISQD